MSFVQSCSPRAGLDGTVDPKCEHSAAYARLLVELEVLKFSCFPERRFMMISILSEFEVVAI